MSLLIRFRFLLMCFAATLFSGCGAPAEKVPDEPAEIDGKIGQTEQAVTKADTDWWKNMWQFSRNWYILTRANQDKDLPVGLNCKEWARKVVLDASKNVVYLPQTSPDSNGWSWNSSAYTQKLQSIYWANYGDVVQMNLSSGPHTAIIYSNDLTNICWIESNWNLDNTVHIRCQTVDSFLKSVTIGGVQRYTAYRITGG